MFFCSPWLEVLGEVHSDEAEEVQFVEQNPFDVEDNQDNVNHNANLEEENEDDINLIDFHGHALIPLGHEFNPLGHGVPNQDEEENPDDMESDDESLFDGV